MTSISKNTSGTWRARFRPVAGGPQISQNFARKVDAQRWLAEQNASVVTGQYVDPKAGRVTFRDYAETWRVAQMHRPSSQAHVETMLRRHAYPTLGDRQLAQILPSEIQAWVKKLGTDDDHTKRKALSANSVGVVHSIVSSVMKAAVRDRRLLANPCEGTRLPRADRTKVVPLVPAEVAAIRDAMPERLQALVTFAAGTGMRQGEVLGLTVDRLLMLRREVVVDRQLVTRVRQDPVLGPPKTKASVRTIPLPNSVVSAMAEHLAAFPPGDDGFVFTLDDGKPLTRQAFGRVWRPAAAAAGLATGSGMHLLRHYYASLLIRYGESVKTVQARLGHASAAETLDTYSHLWPDSDDRTRDAIDSVAAESAESILSPSGHH